MKKPITFIFIFIILTAINSFSMKESSVMRKKIRGMMEWEEKFGFSGSVLVVKNGEIILSEGYGFANRNQGFKNTPQTAFYIASVSKPVTALAVMKLAEEKKICLTDKITKYFNGCSGK